MCDMDKINALLGLNPAASEVDTAVEFKDVAAASESPSQRSKPSHGNFPVSGAGAVLEDAA